MTVYFEYQSVYCGDFVPGPGFQLKHLRVIPSKMNKLLTNLFVAKLPVSLVVKSKYLINHYKKYYGRPIKTLYPASVGMGSDS
jgi:hypothetical protein